MSILTAEASDFGGGRALPNGTYRATVLDAKVETTPSNDDPNKTNSRLVRMYGNLRLPTGETEFAANGGGVFRIGARKLFARSWIDHTNEQAAKIGQREIKREAVAAGLMAKPKKGETVELEFDSWDAYASALLGREVLVRTQQRQRYVHKDTGVDIRKPTPEQIASGDAVPKGETQAEIVAWVEG